MRDLRVVLHLTGAQRAAVRVLMSATHTVVIQSNLPENDGRACAVCGEPGHNAATCATPSARRPRNRDSRTMVVTSAVDEMVAASGRPWAWEQLKLVLSVPLGFAAASDLIDQIRTNR